MKQICYARLCLPAIVAVLVAIIIALLSQSRAPQSHITNTNEEVIKGLISNSLYIDLSINTAPEIVPLDSSNITELKQVAEVIEHNSSKFSEQSVEIIFYLDTRTIQEQSNYKHMQNFNNLQQQTTLYQKLLDIDYYSQLKSWLTSEIPVKVTPVVLELDGFAKKIQEKEEWYSSPFFAFENGYQMCLKVDAAGYDDGEGTHVSVFLYLMKGPHDDKLEKSGHWPLRGTFAIELLNQFYDITHLVQFHHHQCSGKCTDRVLEGVMANAGYGKTKFISHDTLSHYSGSLVFRVSYEDSEAPYQVAPVTFKVTHFSQWLKSNQEWGSSPFFAFDGGYQVHVIIHPADKCEGTHVSVYLGLMKGPHDDKLEQSSHWPMRGTFTIELLNQFNDSDHYSRQVQLHHHVCSECTDRVLEGMMAYNGHGYAQFISHDALLHYTNNNYYVDDSLTFKISYEQMGPSNQVAPVMFNVVKFSQWLSSKEKWYSYPFFAFSEGYQLCLQVYAAGDGNGEGTHVSVYLYLMKGPHDDKLEQSGHWPLRGTFTIELLNQLNDSDHYSHMVQFHHHLWRECSNRVSVDLIANSGCGNAQFISHDTLHNSNYFIGDSIIFRISYEDSEPPYQVAPVTFKLTQFSQWLRNKDIWYSSPFFTFHEGYQMHLKVHTTDDSNDIEISVFLYLTKGPHDDKLEQSGHWPLRGTFTIELLNQLNSNGHYSRMVQFHHHICSECTDRVLKEVMAHRGRGFLHFMSYDDLLYYGYYRNDSLIFRISYEHMEAPNQATPVIFKVNNFSHWLMNKEKWDSGPFIAFEDGYQMCLKVNVAGIGNGILGSVYLYLMKGPHDDKLEQSGHWPLRGIFTIEILNQLNDSDHYSRMVQFHHHICSECTNRVLEEEMAYSGQGFLHFMSYDTLFYHGYYRNDSLIFRISYEHMKPPNQATPAAFKINKFSHWLINKEKWDSGPFIAFEEGYQMCLKVYAAGYGIGEGTHVSVFLYLMKGPHDDKLEQLGHWPLRGTFTIELLNQLNDSDHYSRMVQFHHHWCHECTNRVLLGVMANSGRGLSHFISHDTFLHHNDNNYYRDDSFIFRVSYEDIEPPNQIAPVTFKLSNFTQWRKSKEVWVSSPFLAFTEGYQMFLSIKAADYDEGTHVSVFLYLMKGSYDDKLEQSGHWPLKGRFTIELLNQINDSDHYSPAVMYIPKDSGKRMYGNEIDAVEAVVKFISHETLFKHDGYLKDDSLYFRISYFTNDSSIKGYFIIY